MKSHRALFWHSAIGGNQNILRIQNNAPWDDRQWWSFDFRTQTIRPSLKRTHVLSNRAGYGYRINNHAVIRPFTGKTEDKSRWFEGRRTIRNYGGTCLDVNGNRDAHHAWVKYYNCHNGLNQAWYTDQTKYVYPRQPFQDGVKFQIRSQMKGGKAIYAAGTYLRIQYFNPEDKRQWFTFDRRTRSIRSFYKRNDAISMQSNNWNPQWATVRGIQSNHNVMFQKILAYRRKTDNIKNLAGLCLVSYARRNVVDNHVQWNKCQGRADTSWWPDRSTKINYKRYPIADGTLF
jgi:hypothetical protein